MNDNYNIRDYLISHQLMNENDNLIASKDIPDAPLDYISRSYSEDKIKIYLAALINFFHNECLLDYFKISLHQVDCLNYKLIIRMTNSSNNDCSLYWYIIIDTLDFLIPYMAGSNISYLSSMLTCKKY